MLNAARETFERAADQIRRARPSARAGLHHRHLLSAVAAIDDALVAATRHLRGDRRADVEVMLTPLKTGYGQLQEAADQLPGFELVAFNQGCCTAGQVGQVGAGGAGGSG